MTDPESAFAPTFCDIHKGGEFLIGLGGGHFYLCGCVWDECPDKVVDGQTGPWFRGMTQDERTWEQRGMELSEQTHEQFMRIFHLYIGVVCFTLVSIATNFYLLWKLANV